MKSTTALRAARKLIENERYHHVCHAIKCAYPGKKGIHTEVYREIQCSLNGFTVVDTWLWSNVPGFDKWSESVREDTYAKAMREYRLRWIDEMIAQYEAKGD